EVGIIEPLAVFAQSSDTGTKYLLLDGHLRLSALLALFVPFAPCLVATDDEGFTYNRQINRLSAIQEHHMILRAVEKGVPSERIAATLEINVDQLKARQRLLNGIAP